MFRHPFIACLDCGPAYTLHGAAPSEADATPCAACEAEARDPTARRHGLVEISCPGCGPMLRYVQAGASAEGEAALARALDALWDGKVVAVKGIGGFLLAVDATNEAAVRFLRVRKHRPHKPFAVMARDLEWARRAAHLRPGDEALLLSPARPILLVPGKGEVAPAVAPRLRDVGIFLPGSGLQQLLLDEGPPLQVMTSANLSGAPIAREDREGLALLGTVADAVLLHDRPVRNAADDSVFRATAEGPLPIRRSRGFVPVPLPLPAPSPPLLAVGGNEKNTICLAEGRQAWLSPHLGDPAEPEAWRRLQDTIEAFQAWTGIVPRVVVHDLHPDFPTTRLAQESGLPCLTVPHHHAHVAACLAEHGALGRPALGVAFDGTGLGPDGTLWGGEFLHFDGGHFHRWAHLPALPLAGGEAAIEQPWRAGLAALHAAGLPPELLAGVDPEQRARVLQLLDRPELAPRSTGAGRWFDGVAALCGFSTAISYEGQAAAELEALALDAPADPYPFAIHGSAIDLSVTVRALVEDRLAGAPDPVCAARFHETLAHVIERVCVDARQTLDTATVALAGGVFQNRRLLERTTERLRRSAFRVLLPTAVPPNDGGLSYGQAAVAAIRLAGATEGGGDVSRHSG